MTSEPINWEDYGIYDASGLPADWQVVVDLDHGGGYEWTIFRAFWSPTERRYFWSGGSGCSCNYWDQDLRTPGDFASGDRAALQRAFRSFAGEHEYSVAGSYAIDTTATISTFKES